MFIAMNRFRVTKGYEGDFEHVWLSRDSHLDKVPGFIEFHLLKGPESDDHTLYAPDKRKRFRRNDNPDIALAGLLNSCRQPDLGRGPRSAG